MVRKSFRVVAGVVQKDGCYFITQRRKSAKLALFWEFPGGKVEEGESDEVALVRELSERLDAKVRVGKKLAETEHHYADGASVTLALYEAKLDDTQPLRAKRVEDFRFVPPNELGFYSFPDADQQVMALLDLS